MSLVAVRRCAAIVAVVCSSLTAWSPPHVEAGPNDAVGRVISSDPMPRTQWLPGAASVTRIVYRTADGAGRPGLSSAVLYLPIRPARTVVSWAHGANGLADRCAPSIMGRPGREKAYFAALLAAGFAVVATDYIGLGTPGPAAFLDAGGEANAVADAVLAARQRHRSLDSWIADGHSQGAHATINAAATGAARTSGLRFLGAAATSFPPPVDDLVGAVTPQTPPLPIDISGLYLMALRGFATTHPDLHIERHLSPFGARLFVAIDSLCVDDINARTKGIAPSALLRTALSPQEARAFARYLRMPTRGITRPLFLGSGLRDALLPLPAVLPVVAQLRANGVDTRFHVYDNGHDDIIEASRADRLAFLHDLTRR